MKNLPMNPNYPKNRPYCRMNLHQTTRRKSGRSNNYSSRRKYFLRYRRNHCRLRVLKERKKAEQTSFRLKSRPMNRCPMMNLNRRENGRRLL